MVQGCNINILDTMKAPTMKAVKVATEEQKRLAQLSHIERIDQIEDSLITRMVEITSHTYEECAMELRGTDMDMETAINNLLEGNAEEWQTTKKKVRPEKPPKVIAPEVEVPVIVKSRDSTQGRSSSRGRGRGGSTIERSNDKDKSTDRSVEEKNRRNRERTNYSARGAAGRGRAGKRQLPPRMDRQRYSNSRDGSREGSDSTHRRGGGYNRGGRANHYRDRGADNGDHKEPNWDDNTTEDNWASKAEGWANTDAAESPGWGAPKDEVIEDTKDTESEQWTDAVENQTEPPVAVNGDAHPAESHSAPDFTDYSLTTSIPAEAPAVETTRKRPAYTQAFTKSFSQTTAPTSLSSLITSTNDSFTAGAPTSTVFSDPKTSAFSEPFAFSQAQSTVDSLSSCLDSVPDYTSRHEQATLKNEDRQSDLKLLQEALHNNSSIPAGRKISVEQLFQTQIGQMHDKPIVSVPESLEERLSPASPPTSSTSSNNSARRSKRPQRSIPTEPVEMPGHTMESLDVQFGSIGFMDNTEDEEVLECPEIEKTPCVSKTDAATSTTPGAAATTPHSVVSAPSAVFTSSSPFTAPQETLTEIPGIHQVGPLRDTTPQSPQQSSAAAVAPPNLPPPNIDNIRSANNLITQLPNTEEEDRSKSLLEQQRSHIATSYSSNTSSSYPQQQQQQQQQQVQQQSKREAKSLPPGVSMYPNPQAQTGPSPQQSHQQQQPLMRPPYNYSSQGSFESNAGVYEQPQHTQHHKYYSHLSNYESQQSHQMHGHLQTQHSSREPSSYSQSQSEHKQYSRPTTDHLTSTSSYHQPAAHIGAGLTSGITHTGNNVAHSAHSAAAIGGTGVAGYPGPVMGHYYSFPPAPYHNMYAGAPNAYYPHFSPAHAQPIGFAQQQAKQSSSVGGYPTNANSHYGEATSNHSASHQYHTSAQYDDSYKDMYSQSSSKQHQLPVTTSTPSDFSKMGMPEKNMFNVGFMHYPANNFFPQLQQTQQAQQALLQRGLAADQSSARSSQQPGAALNPSAKHYNSWAHR